MESSSPKPISNATQETLALLMIIELGNRDIAAGRTIASGEVFRRLRARLRNHRPRGKR